VNNSLSTQHYAQIPKVFFFLVLLLAFFISALAQAETPPPSAGNPKPAEGDLILPMPDDQEMVFRQIMVPGKGFWGDQSRIIQIGDAAGGIFEGLQRTQISGSFPGEDNTWEIILAKYELTRGQYVAIMGMDHFLATSKDPEDQKIPTLEGRPLRDALMKPLAFVSYQDVQEFVRQYNAWLFDPKHPERIKDIPRIDGIPGFLRLPTEDEWEYCARGGLQALETGVFDNTLPFTKAEANEFAWHLGNAKHQLRPIGLRKADVHGLHDLFGNVQEMTSGLFRPEIWQGKPGGVAVRGGNVSTPQNDLRSSLRSELDVYAWNADTKTIEERRSFNTGARLAIGTNVVVNTAQRTQIEQEYHAYHEDLRRTMPVGQTLDNLVAQATVQITDTDPIIERLIAENPNLQAPLSAMQATLATAKERLELAQRESARSLTQDAARNGVNVSVYLSRLMRLTETLKTAQELAEVSARYQDQLVTVQKSITEIETALQEQIQGYKEKISSLGEYEQSYIDHAYNELKTKDMTKREALVMEILKTHVLDFSKQRRADTDQWLENFRSHFHDFTDS